MKAVAGMCVCQAWYRPYEGIASPRWLHIDAPAAHHHLKMLLLAGARVMFGGKALQGHSIPQVYGAIEPTAVFVPLQSILSSPEAFKTAVTEVFGPLQVSSTPAVC